MKRHRVTLGLRAAVLTVGLAGALAGCGGSVSAPSFLDKSGPQYAPTGDRTVCATVTNPAAVVTVFHSDTSDPAPTCDKPLATDFSWADPAVPGHTLVCTTDNTQETAKIYDATGPSDYSKGLCDSIANDPAFTVTYP